MEKCCVEVFVGFFGGKKSWMIVIGMVVRCQSRYPKSQPVGQP